MELTKNREFALELTRRILDDGSVVDLRQERERHKIPRAEQMFIGTPVQDIEEDEDSRSYQAYLKYREENGDLGLKSHLRKVNIPEINNSVSVFTHEDNLLSQSIVVAIVFLAKPLFSMNVNLPNEESTPENLNSIKNYLERMMPSIKTEIVSRYSGNKPKKIDLIKKTEIKVSGLDEKISDNLVMFTEILIGNFLMWAKLTSDNEQAFFESDTPEDVRLGERIDSFIEKEFEEIFNRINC